MTEQMNAVFVTAEPTKSSNYYQSLIDDFDLLKDLVVFLCELRANCKINGTFFVLGDI
jgi:hypothetical protein